MDKKKVTDINELTIKKFTESLRPENPEIRSQLDFGYSYNGQTAEIYEIRPVWDNLSKTVKLPFAKIRFYKSAQLWKLYWMRANGKWELYEPFPESTHLDKIIDVIKQDEYSCFFG
ncbi:MAG: DUF3024 domain-containing protein [Chlorobi bacterium]|nr:DUF3024 domain-containing protein [Chlorobiota bacterium]